MTHPSLNKVLAAINGADKALDNSSLAKVSAALDKLKSAGADTLKAALEDLDSRLSKLEKTQDAFAVPAHRRKG